MGMSIHGMKKLGLSLFVILLFVAYSFQQRNSDEASVVVAPASSSLPSTTSGSSTVSTTGDSGTSMMNAGQSMMATYKDGSYTGSRSDAVYGYIQVRATISGGKITGVTFLEYPNDHHESVQINKQAMPYLQQEALKAQSAQVDGVSGATDTSQAFVESLTAALNKAKA